MAYSINGSASSASGSDAAGAIRTGQAIEVGDDVDAHDIAGGIDAGHKGAGRAGRKRLTSLTGQAGHQTPQDHFSGSSCRRQAYQRSRAD